MMLIFVIRLDGLVLLFNFGQIHFYLVDWVVLLEEAATD